MKAIQIRIDEKLLARLDWAARERHVSRSAFIRHSVEVALSAGHLRTLVEADRRAYRAKPLTAEERAGYRALATSQDQVLSKLGDKDRW